MLFLNIFYYLILKILDLQGFFICVKVLLGGDNMSYLSREISTIDSYKLSKLNEGDIIPIVSDVMFETMFNNTKRKKYVSYLLSLILEKNYEEI